MQKEYILHKLDILYSLDKPTDEEIAEIISLEESLSELEDLEESFFKQN